jgi:SRSO17 transposase
MVEAHCPCPDEPTLAAPGRAALAELVAVLRRQVRRPEAAQHAVDYLRGLLAEVERKNGWQLAEHAGYAHPRGMQRVLDRYVWDAEAVRDELRTVVIEHIGDPAGVLVIDETGFPKQGTHSVGVQRQYCGTLGKIGNCQVGVFLAYASPQGYAALDRALYLPRPWLDDPVRCQQAGVPPDLPFRTKPQQALAMVECALATGVPAAWVVGDEIYGSDGALRRALETRGQAYVLAVRGTEQPSRWPSYGSPGQVAMTALAAAVAPNTWQRLSCGEGSQGPRTYDWAAVSLRPALREGWDHTALFRRHLTRKDEIASYLVYAPADTPLEELVRVAGTRWTIEAVFKLAKGQVGLDQYEVRSYQGWYRHITLALLALAVLAIGTAKKGDVSAPGTFRSPCPNSADSSSGSAGRHPTSRSTSSPGRAGAGTTNASPNGATAASV